MQRTPAAPRQRPERRVFLLVGYLLVAGIALRLHDYRAETGPVAWPILSLLGLYLVCLTAEQFIEPPFPGQHHLYLALQTGIVTAAMLLVPSLDFLGTLFFPLSTQALLYFPRRAGKVWIVVFTLIFTAILAWYHSIGLALFYAVASVFFASYGALMAQTVIAHRQLEVYAAQVEDLTLASERQRLARELHDTLAQGLAGLILQLEAVDSHLARGSVERAQSIVQQAMTRARHTLADARRAIADLRGGDPTAMDLARAIREEVERFTAATGLACDLDLRPLPVLPEHLREPVFRTISEGLTNIARHARAQRVSVQVVKHDGALDVRVSDNGVGFSPLAIDQLAGHYGLIGLRERARLAGGTLRVTSEPGHGTTLGLRLPLAELAYG